MDIKSFQIQSLKKFSILDFNSITFLLFLFIVVVTYYNLNQRSRLILLLISSFIFYSFWNWKFSSLLIISGLTDYFISQKIFNSVTKRKKLSYLSVSVFINLGLLIYFKYLFFITSNVNYFLENIGSAYSFDIIDIILPFGISFYTFETISYSVDVYRGIIKPEKSFFKYALFVAFFPKLVAGPIQRASEFLPQFEKKISFNIENIKIGVKRIIIGLFLKVVFADNIADLVDQTYNLDFNNLSAIDFVTMGYLFGFQIYFDFSAYSNIAIGSAKLFGINIPENFNFPYIAKSFKDFWKRWHISLSAWIKDYLYLPLAGVKIKSSSAKEGIGESIYSNDFKNKKNFALFLTWIIMGFWHGANWNFALWGLMHAIFIFFERKINEKFKKLGVPKFNFLNWFVTLNLVMISWLPFRVNNLNDLKIIIYKFFEFDSFFTLNLRENIYLIVSLLTISFCIVYFTEVSKNRLLNIIKNNYLTKILFFGFILSLTIIFLEVKSQFIYFQF